jgi:hypothetical protein
MVPSAVHVAAKRNEPSVRRERTQGQQQWAFALFHKGDESAHKNLKVSGRQRVKSQQSTNTPFVSTCKPQSLEQSSRAIARLPRPPTKIIGTTTITTASLARVNKLTHPKDCREVCVAWWSSCHERRAAAAAAPGWESTKSPGSARADFPMDVEHSATHGFWRTTKTSPYERSRTGDASLPAEWSVLVAAVGNRSATKRKAPTRSYCRIVCREHINRELTATTLGERTVHNHLRRHANCSRRLPRSSCRSVRDLGVDATEITPTHTASHKRRWRNLLVEPSAVGGAW